MNIHLSPSLHWAERAALPVEPGVYVISKADAVVYIGKTWGTGGLRERISDFHRSATTGQKGHAGGVTFHGLFGVIEPADIAVAVHVPVIVRRDADVGLSGISCVGGHDGEEGDLPWPDAKSPASLTRSWTSCWPAPIPRQPSIRTACSTI